MPKSGIRGMFSLIMFSASTGIDVNLSLPTTPHCLAFSIFLPTVQFPQSESVLRLLLIFKVRPGTAVAQSDFHSSASTRTAPTLLMIFTLALFNLSPGLPSDLY